MSENARPDAPIVQPEALLTVQEAARLLCLSPGHLRNLVWRRAIPFVKLGKAVRFDPAALRGWVADQAVPMTEGAV